MKRSWSWREWLPNADTLTLIGVTTTAETVVVEAEANGPSCARCPNCGRRSEARHSRYWRTLKDLAAQGRSVALRVRVTRWRCCHRGCATRLREMRASAGPSVVDLLNLMRNSTSRSTSSLAVAGRPDDALVIARRAAALGFSTTVGIIHDHNGQMPPLEGEQRRILEAVAGMAASLLDFAHYNRFQKNLQRVGQPHGSAVPGLAIYMSVRTASSTGARHSAVSRALRWSITGRRISNASTGRSSRAHRSARWAVFIAWRSSTNCAEALVDWFTPTPNHAAAKMPIPIRALSWMFVANPHRDLFREAVQRVFGIT